MKIPPFFAGPVDRQRDWLSSGGAESLAAVIMRAWRKAGHHNVIAWVDPKPFQRRGKESSYFRVCTNLVNGLPPR